MSADIAQTRDVNLMDIQLQALRADYIRIDETNVSLAAKVEQLLLERGYDRDPASE